MRLNISVDLDGAMKALDRLERELAPKAASAALNRVATSARAEAVREIARKSGLTQAEVRKHIDIVTANRGNLEAQIIARPWSPNLIRFKARQTPQGVVASPWRNKRVHKHTFIGNQGRTVFVRQGKGRLPIKSVRGPSVKKEFLQGYAIKAMEKKVAERFGIEFDRALRAMISRRK